MGLRGPYAVLGIKLGLTVCKFLTQVLLSDLSIPKLMFKSTFRYFIKQCVPGEEKP